LPSETAGRAKSRDERYPPAERVCLRRDYDRAYRSGTRAGARHLVLHAAPNGLDHPRLGTTVSRKVGGAVVRNRIKRRLRDLFRRNRDRFPPGMDVVIGVRPSAATSSYEDLRTDLFSALRRLIRKAEE
jgi:ribonuclease P protein component